MTGFSPRNDQVEKRRGREREDGEKRRENESLKSKKARRKAKKKKAYDQINEIAKGQR